MIERYKCLSTCLIHAWEQRKFGLLFEKNLEKNKNSEFDASRTISIATMHFKEEGNGAAESSLATYKVLRVGDIAYEGHTSKQFAFGRFVLNDIGDGIMSPRFTTLRPTSDRPISFWKQYIHYEPIMRHLLVRSTKNGTMMNELVIPDLEKESLLVPSESEQKQIGAFFDKLDETIALHQRKLKQLMRLKQGFLQVLFANEATIPKVRFANFTEEWEQRKLGKLATIVRGASPRPIQDPKWFDTESEVGWLRISDVTEQDGRIYYLEQHISKLGQEKTRVLLEPHLLLSIAATVGKPVVNYVKTGVHDGFLIFLNAIFEREFMFQWLEMFRPKWQKYGQPGSQVNLNSELVRNQEISIPNNEEQQKIGAFFKQLDKTITLQQKKISQLKNLKKALLQSMFI